MRSPSDSNGEEGAASAASSLKRLTCPECGALPMDTEQGPEPYSPSDAVMALRCARGHEFAVHLAWDCAPW